jgi:ABC-type transport system involved in multi-copper enzyme maturation permease subunit
MRLFRVFLGHELITQWRSVRFRGLTAVYVLVASIPGVVMFLIASRTTHLFGPAAYNMILVSQQPLLTALFAVGLAVDAIARERDEGSFAVLSVAPISSAGYVLWRWLALLSICIPVSLMPTLVTAALAGRRNQVLPLLSMFAGGWLVFVLPALLVSSALALAIGTITGRTVLAIIFGAVLISAGIGMINGLAFYRHLNFDGPGDLFTGGSRNMQELAWMIRGYWFGRTPSDAAFPLRTEARALLSRAGITAAISIVLLALSTFYLRRTRRDLRPWRIPEKHQLRTMLKTINRIREEYAPDSGSSTSDRVVLAAGVALAVSLCGYLIRRQETFAALAADRYAAESTAGVPTSTSVVMDSVRVDARVTLGGALRSRAVSVIRNDSARPETHLSFMLNPLVAVRRLTVGRGRARVRRAWERLDVELDPPLAPHESRTLSFDLDGMPADIDFALQSPGSFAEQWNRYLHAPEVIYMTDLSRSTVAPAATEVRMNLRGSDIAPVIRYTVWALKPAEQGEGFMVESVVPPMSIDVRLDHPYPLAADSCGTVTTRSRIVSHCTDGFASYVVFGGPLARRSIGAEAELAYIPAHERMAVTQSASLSSSIRRAAEAWPGLALPPHIVFIERPAEAGQRRFFRFQQSSAIEQIGARGSVFLIPEDNFTVAKSINPNAFAASIVSGTLRARRRVIAEQSSFFSRFYDAVAFSRLGMRKTNAVEPGTGLQPDPVPLLTAYWRPESRMSKVLAALEYRAGADHFAAGVNDFTAAAEERPGTAKELVDAIGRRAGLDLSQAYADYFVGNALPKLTLTDVAFHRSGAQWVVTAVVKNTGTGESFVPIALRTSQGSLWQTVRVSSGGRAPFSVTTSGEPHSVQLDPEGVCYRQAAVGLIETVEYRGQP